MDCPYLEEVVMVFCRAYPVKKLVPRSGIAMRGPCQGESFDRCPLFQEVLARTGTGEEDGKEGSP